MLFRFISAFVSALHLHLLRFGREYVGLIVIVFIVVGAFYVFFLAPPRDFPLGEVLRIESGVSLGTIASELSAAHVIRSPIVFEALLRVTGDSRTVHSGAYRFDTPLSVFGVAKRIVAGESGIAPVKITFPEGITASGMSLRLGEQFTPAFARAFLNEAKASEGYLFPDTYLFSPSETPQSVLGLMRANFDSHMASLSEEMAGTGRSLHDVVTMASLVEREANTDTDRRVIAGILWRRLEIGMPLQVDAVFAYIKDIDAYAPTLDDLKINSPYNTYTHQGLPPTPIGNPGLAALTAALEPTKTSYLYYLTGSDGKMHYAKTFAEHQANKLKYLK